MEHTSFASAWILAENIAAGVTCELIAKSREYGTARSWLESRCGNSPSFSSMPFG